MEWIPAIQTSAPKSCKIQAKLNDLLQEYSYTRVQVAVAYATISGIHILLDAFIGKEIESEWLLGLDDLITQPGVLDLVQSLPGAKLRVASLNSEGARFHSKLFRFSTKDEKHQFIMVGSPNLTHNALNKNSETVIFLKNQSMEDSERFSNIWGQLWEQGNALTAENLTAYRTNFNAAKVFKQKLHETEIFSTTAKKSTLQKAGEPKHKIKSAILTSDNAELDPSQASIGWMECGSMTSQGTELEIKKEFQFFFGLDPVLHMPQQIKFRLPNGQDISLKIVYRSDNSMWRITLPSGIKDLKKFKPESGNRWPCAAVFSRLGDNKHFGLTFLSVTSPEFKALRNKAESLGTSARTRGVGGRYYGWR